MSDRAWDARYHHTPFSHQDSKNPHESSKPVGQPLGGKASDEDLIAAALQGDEGAFEQLFHRYRTKVLDVCRQFCNGDATQAHDICQETFITAFQNLRLLRDPSRFLAWICSIAKNKCISFGRKQRVMARNLEDYQSLRPAMISKRGDWTELELMMIDEAIQRLDKKEIRQTIQLFYMRGKRIPEIARIQNISQTAVTSRLNRFRIKLRKQMARLLIKKGQGR